MAGPAYEARRANTAFRRTEIRAIEETSGAPSCQVIFGPIVTTHDDDSVVGDPELVELVNQHAKVVVEHQQAVAPVAVGAGAFEFVARDHRKVHQRMIEVEKERLVRSSAAPHEVQPAQIGKA